MIILIYLPDTADLIFCKCVQLPIFFFCYLQSYMKKKFTSLEQYVITVNDILAHLFINEIIINMIILMFVFYKTV